MDHAGAPPAAPSPMEQLADAMAHLADISALHLATSVSKTSSVMKPVPFKGQSGDDARRFLAGFTLWAMTQGTGMNVIDHQGVAVRRRDLEWIRAVLSFMEDDAAVWASPAMEQFAEARIPFGGNWGLFQDEFKARFEAVDEVIDAKEKLRALYQGASSVPEYTAQFKQLMARTRYSSADLRDRYYDHLNSRIKDELVHSLRDTDAFNDLVAVATKIDTRVRQCRAEKERERPRPGVTTGAPSTRAPPPAPTFTTTSAADPNVMDVDATRTRDEYMRRMRGRCFGCGSLGHNKRDGNHERDLCRHCKRTGHRESVCMDKFVGRSQSQKAAATEEENFSLDNFSLDSSSLASSEIDWSEVSPDGSEVAEVAATSSTTGGAQRATLAQLLEQQKALAEQIEILREQDF
jgi:hypothetical protein